MKTTARLVILLCAATKCLILTAGAHASQCQGISHETTEGLCALESFDNPQVIYFGSRRGLYKTEDAGSNWRCVTTTMNTPVYDIAQDRRKNMPRTSIKIGGNNIGHIKKYTVQQVRCLHDAYGIDCNYHRNQYAKPVKNNTYKKRRSKCNPTFFENGRQALSFPRFDQIE